MVYGKSLAVVLKIQKNIIDEINDYDPQNFHVVELDMRLRDGNTSPGENRRGRDSAFG